MGFGERDLLGSCGLGKQDFISHEKWRELQLSDMDSFAEKEWSFELLWT